jgi:hypothetical protein
MTSGGNPGENYDIVFNGAAPTRAISRRRLYINPVTYAFWEEMKANPNIPYKPFGAGS